MVRTSTRQWLAVKSQTSSKSTYCRDAERPARVCNPVVRRRCSRTVRATPWDISTRSRTTVVGHWRARSAAVVSALAETGMDMTLCIRTYPLTYLCDLQTHLFCPQISPETGCVSFAYTWYGAS